VARNWVVGAVGHGEKQIGAAALHQRSHKVVIANIAGGLLISATYHIIDEESEHAPALSGGAQSRY